MPPLIAVFAGGRRIGAARGKMTTAPTPIAKPVTQLPLRTSSRRIPPAYIQFGCYCENWWRDRFPHQSGMHRPQCHLPH